MKKILTTVLVAAGLGLAGLSGAAAAPANGGAIGNAATLLNQIEQTQYYGGGYYYKPRYYKPACYYVRKCDYYGRCWREKVCH